MKTTKTTGHSKREEAHNRLRFSPESERSLKEKYSRWEAERPPRFDSETWRFIKGEEEWEFTIGARLREIKSFMEGSSEEEFNSEVGNLLLDEVEIFKKGANWAAKKYVPVIRELIYENRDLKQENSSLKTKKQNNANDKSRVKIEPLVLRKLIKEHRRGGKPNWSAISRELPNAPDPETVKARAINKGLFSE